MKNNSKAVLRSDLLSAAQKMGLSDLHAEKLWEDLNTPVREASASKVSRVLYFFGALVICLALVWFMGSRYALYGTIGLLLISIAYEVVFMGVGLYLWKVKQKRTLGGLGIFLGLSLVPLITYAFQDLMGWWPGQFPGQYSDFFCWVRGGWAVIELATICSSLILLHFIKFPLLTVPFYIALWFMTMDIAAVFSWISADQAGYANHLMNIRMVLALSLGLVVSINAIFLDRLQKRAFGFWGHIFGVAIFWSGMALIDDTRWLEKAICCLLHVSMIVLSPVLERRVYLVFGSFGLLFQLFWLAHEYFANSVNFPLILSGIGLAIVSLGLIIQRKFRKRTFAS